MANVNYILLHFFNREISSLYDIHDRLSRSEIHKYHLILIRGALLACEKGLILPVASLFEASGMEQLLKEIKPLQQAGLIYLYSPTSDLQEYAKKKAYEFRDQPEMFPRYSSGPPDLSPSVRSLVWLPRLERSAFADISSQWHESFEFEGLWDRVFERNSSLGMGIGSRLQQEIWEVPERLEGRAFVFRFISPLLPLELHPRDRTQIELLISQGYLLSYLEEYGATILIDTPLGELSCGISGIRQDGSLVVLSFRRYQYLLEIAGFGNLVRGILDWESLVQFRQNLAFRWLNKHLIRDVSLNTNQFENALRIAKIDPNVTCSRSWFHGPMRLLVDRAWRIYDRLGPLLNEDEGRDISHVSQGPIFRPRRSRRKRRKAQDAAQLFLFNGKMVAQMKERTVFLIHGRDERAAQWMRTFLRDLGLRPLEWTQAVRLTGSGSPYILDVVRRGMENAQGAVVLFTPDEKVELRPELCRDDTSSEEGIQSRPNVWIEAGMALAMHPSNTILVEVGPHRPASDLSGLHFVRIRTGNSTSLLELAQRLQGIGCEVDLTGTDFLRRELDMTPLSWHTSATSP